MKNYLSCTSFVISKQGNPPRDETPTMEIFQEQELPLSNISISLKTSSKVGKQEQEPHLKPEKSWTNTYAHLGLSSDLYF